MTQDPDDSVTRVVAALRGGPHTHSALYRWLRDNYDALSAARREGMRANWLDVANALNELGIRTRDKRRLRPETVRRTWARVVADMAPKPAKASPSPATVRTPPAAVANSPTRARLMERLRPVNRTDEDPS